MTRHMEAHQPTYLLSGEFRYQGFGQEGYKGD